MTSPFKSTRSLAARRRQRPVVERSTFVVVSIGPSRLAFPVEQVERVVRVGRDDDLGAEATVAHQGRAVRVHCLAQRLGGETTRVDKESRVLVVRADAVHHEPCAVRVDRVHEVVAIETALVQPVAAQARAPFSHTAVRGQFEQAASTVWVVDANRLGVDA
jgi:chemotaxis signal transduction protein